MSKEMYKQRLETLRTQIKLEKSLKKADAAHFAKLIKLPLFRPARRAIGRTQWHGLQRTTVA